MERLRKIGIGMWCLFIAATLSAENAMSPVALQESPKDTSSGINFSLWKNVATQPTLTTGYTWLNVGALSSMNRLKGFGLNILGATVRTNMSGVQIGGISNMVGEQMKGFQFAGISNMVGENMRGVTFSGLTTIVGDGASGWNNRFKCRRTAFERYRECDRRFFPGHGTGGGGEYCGKEHVRGTIGSLDQHRGQYPGCPNRSGQCGIIGKRPAIGVDQYL